MRILVFFFLVVFSGDALAKCYDWQLRRGQGNRFVHDASTIYVDIPGVPKKLSDFRVKVRGVLTPRIKFGECLDEKKRGKRARNYTVKLVSRAKKIQFCEPAWEGQTRGLQARVMIDGHDLSKVLVEKGFGRSSESGNKSWCIR